MSPKSNVNITLSFNECGGLYFPCVDSSACLYFTVSFNSMMIWFLLSSKNCGLCLTTKSPSAQKASVLVSSGGSELSGHSLSSSPPIRSHLPSSHPPLSLSTSTHPSLFLPFAYPPPPIFSLCLCLNECSLTSGTYAAGCSIPSL